MVFNRTPLLTVDCVVFYLNSILLIKRKYQPFKDHFALPGGFVDIGETVESACLRELEEETNLKLNKEDLNFVGVYSNPDRDPRRNTVSITYYAKIYDNANIKPGDDATSAQFVKEWKEKKMAFDHALIIKDAFSKYNNNENR